ncbi:unnamed protein product [Dovyalis caffra]|uniref:RRM domain-containing protein n=1 Tax=Dovyalis caffra TaxID=77055 RepID=A0AAV1S1X9_9ROSI|nr:unnamed protein product [Dovyalis caffra]
MRGGSQRGSRSDMRHRNDENSVRVDCLLEDTRESDLNDLFRPFGQITPVCVATDCNTGLSREKKDCKCATRDMYTGRVSSHTRVAKFGELLNCLLWKG